jgi:hypothetical protein
MTKVNVDGQLEWVFENPVLEEWHKKLTDGGWEFDRIAKGKDNDWIMACFKKEGCSGRSYIWKSGDSLSYSITVCDIDVVRGDLYA